MSKVYVFEGEGHTLGSLLQKELLEQDQVLKAGYEMSYDNNRLNLFLHVYGGDNDDTMKFTVNKISEQIDLFRKALSKAVA